MTRKVTGFVVRVEFEINVAGGNPVIFDVELMRTAFLLLRDFGLVARFVCDGGLHPRQLSCHV